jgi:hypothetical protein
MMPAPERVATPRDLLSGHADNAPIKSDSIATGIFHFTRLNPALRAIGPAATFQSRVNRKATSNL